MLVFTTLVTVLLCYCSETVLYVVCHMFLELYSLYCNDLLCPLNNSNAPESLFGPIMT